MAQGCASGSVSCGLFFLQALNDKSGRLNLMLGGPGQLLFFGKAAAVMPTLGGVGTAANTMLARKRLT